MKKKRFEPNFPDFPEINFPKVYVFGFFGKEFEKIWRKKLWQK